MIVGFRYYAWFDTAVSALSHLTQLRSFIETYRQKSLSVAASRLGISQPGVSAHIRTLETLIERPLFVRRARGIEPTPIADDLARAIGGSLDQAESALSGAKARSKVLGGTMHIAGPSEFMRRKVAPFLATLPALGIEVRVQLGNRARIYELLDSGAVRLAVTASLPIHPNYEREKIATETLLLVAAPEIARQLRAVSSLTDGLSSMPIVAYDEELPLIREYLRHVFDLELASHAAVTAPDLETVAQLCIAGAGWTVLPDYLVSEAIERGELECPDPESARVTNELFLVWPRIAARDARTMFVKDHLQAMFQPFLPD
jgi:DNA-binding transcriptional LysR family regulator